MSEKLDLKGKVTKALSRIASSEPIGFREFLWLCLPAILVGLLLRGYFLWVTPQGYFGADSPSYFHFSHDLLLKGEFELSPKRRWFYPIVLFLLTPLPVASWYLVPFVQHLLGLVTVLGIGWITLRFSVWPRFTVPIVTLICAIWPRMLWYEHEFIAESFVLAAFVLTVSLALIPGIFRSRRGLFLVFLSLIMLAGFKAVGRFFWLGAIVAIVIYAGDPRRWAWTVKSALAAIASAVVAVTVGQNSQGYWLLLNSVLPLVQEKGEPYGRYRTLLKPLILEARQFGDNYPWKKFQYKKKLKDRSPSAIHPEWVALLKDESRFADVARSLSTQAIRENPFTFAKYTLSSMAIATKRGGVLPRYDPPVFWRDLMFNARRIHEQKKKPSYTALAFGVDSAGLNRLAAQGSTKRYKLLDFHYWVDQQLRPLEQPDDQPGLASLRVRPFGWFVGLGLLLCLRPRWIRRAALLLIPSALYAIGVFAVGDAVPRYLHPVEWVGFVLGGIAIEFVVRKGFHLARRLPGTLPDPSEPRA